MAVVRGPHTPANKCSHNSVIQTTEHFPPLIPNLEGLEHLSLLLSIGEDRSVQTFNTEEHVLKRECPHETNSNRVKCCIHDNLKSTAWAVAIPIPFTSNPGSQACRMPSPRLCVVGLFNNMLSLPFICQCSFQMRQVLPKTASYIFTTTISGQRIMLTVYASLYTSNSSALMFRQVLLLTVW